MELKQVREYVDLYLEGKTSLAQEQTLFAYFSQIQVDEKYRAKTILRYAW